MSGRIRTRTLRRRAERCAEKHSPKKVLQSLKTFEAMGFLIVESGPSLDDDHPDAERTFRFLSENAWQKRMKSNPNIYRTPAGNFITMTNRDGSFDHWMTPDEAVEWKVNSAAIDLDNPAGTRLGPRLEGDDSSVSLSIAEICEGALRRALWL